MRKIGREPKVKPKVEASLYEPPNNTVKMKAAVDSLDRMEAYFNHLTEVGFYPHSGQAPILKTLFSPKFKIKKAFLQCSRGFGKTSTAAIYTVGHALLNMRHKIYIVGPLLDLTVEIYCHGGDMDLIIPPCFYPIKDSYKSCFHKSEARWSFDTDSFIKVEGADDEASVKGIKPHLLVADEFQDWKKAVWEYMEPNMLANNAPILFVGTPPDRRNAYIEQGELCKKKWESGDKAYFYTHKTIYDNPRMDRKAIEDIRQNLIDKGDEAVWKREYLAEFIPGGSAAIYPQFTRATNLVDREKMVSCLKGHDTGDLVPFTVFDPSGTRFACSGFLYEPNSSWAYMVFSIVEEDSKKIAMRELLPRVLKLEGEWFPEFSNQTPIRVADEAAKLWIIDANSYGLDITPTSKRQNEKSNVILLVRDMFLREKFLILDELTHVADEIENYHYDENNKIHKKKDDIIDTIHYFVAESGYQIPETAVRKESNLSVSRRWEDDQHNNFVAGNGGIGFNFDDIGDFL